MAFRFEQSGLHCQSTFCNDGTNNVSGKVPDYSSRRSESMKLIRKLDSQASTPMDLDNPSLQELIMDPDLEAVSKRTEKKPLVLSNHLRKACEDNLEFSRLLYGEIAQVRTKCVESIIR